MFIRVLAFCLLLLQGFWLSGCVSLEAFMIERETQQFNDFVQKNTELAENGDVTKQVELAKMYLHGKMPDSLQSEFATETDLTPPYRFAIPQNRDTALDLLYKAAQQGNDEAKWLYAYIVFRGYDQSKYAYSNELLQELADKGNTQALAVLGTAYTFGFNGIDQDIEKAKEIFEKVPDEPFTKYSLGEMYYSGKGFKKDLKKAFDLVQEATNAGLYEAKIGLAYLYLMGEGCEKSPQQAVVLAHQAYLDSFENGEGDANATGILARVVFENPAFDYEYGNVTKAALEHLVYCPLDSYKINAYKMIASFAGQGRLGFTIVDWLKSLNAASELGDNVAKQALVAFEEKKLDNLNKAEQGDADAQFELMNYFYFVGDNFVPNPQRAIYYAQKLVANNNPKGLVFLARVHMEGVHLPADRAKILTYMQTAANMGDPEAVKFMSEYQAYLQQQQQQMIQAQNAYIMQRQILDTVNLINQLNDL